MQTTYLDVQNIQKSFGDRLLFHDVSFSIADQQHVGLIAKNGTGKSTLLKIIVGDEVPDEGNVVYRNGVHVGYLDQSPHFDPSFTVLEACMKGLVHDDNIELKARKMLSVFDINDFSLLISQLSGGQVKRVALASILLHEPDLLILDEPTNHLDLKMIEWLENYLTRYTKALLMVTHDRYFLNRICTTILELDNRTLYTYRGNYENYVVKREDRLNSEESGKSRMRNLYRKEIEWMRRMPKARGGKSKSRKDAFYDLEDRLNGVQQDKKMQWEGKDTYIGKKIFEAQYVSFSFPGNNETVPEKIILNEFYYNFSRYEKLGIIGGNGTGKSTFVKLLLGELKPQKGRFVIGETIRFGYFSQQGIEFDQDEKVIDAVTKYAEYIEMGGGKKMSAMQFLDHFLFPPQRQQDYIRKLSGGELRRLYLCTVLMQNPNFLVLDEPTNDLDIVTLQILEEYLQSFKGCLIIISHDRYFMDKVVDHLMIFEGEGEVSQYAGNYTQYREWEKEQQREQEQMGKPEINGGVKDAQQIHQRKLTYKEKVEFEKLEKDIKALEAQKKDIERELSEGNLPYEEIELKAQTFSAIKEELEEKEMRWLELSEI